MSLLVKNGRVLDPDSRTDRELDIRVAEGRVVEIGAPGSVSPGDGKVIDATTLWVLPGLIDLHVHLRDPGQEYKEDIASGSAAAVWGGFTTIAAMPNTEPVIDGAELVQYVARRGREVGLCRVLPVGAVTVGQKGAVLAPFGEMRRAGAVAVSDDGHPVANAGLMRRALEYSRDHGLPVLSHAEEPTLSKGGQMHEGVVSTKLGLPGVPRVSEDVAVARDLALAEFTGGHLHVCHVSTAGAVEAIRQAKGRGVKVTAEATPHHFSLTHEAVIGYDTFTKMSPPLREEADRLALIAGLRDGTLDAIATDHAPHSSIEKDVDFASAANGVIGLQTALPASLELHRRHDIPLLDLIARLTVGPARIFGLDGGRIAEGERADLILVDPEARWELSEDLVVSKSHNSPFLGQPLQGRVQTTVYAGKVVYRHGQRRST